MDLRRAELRIPSYGVRVQLPASLAGALAEENRLTPRPEFVLQLTSRDKLRMVAKRAPPLPLLEAPLQIVAVDENSAHGFTVTVFDFDDRSCRLTLFERLRPPNHGYRRQLAALLQGFADAPSEERHAQLHQLLPKELVEEMAPERAKELTRQARKKEKRLNNAFIQRFAALVRKLTREAAKEGRAAVVLVDPINHESLKRTRLQGTLLRARRVLENLCRYEGALFVELCASGKRCPFCGSWGLKARQTKHARVYKCWKCNIEWNRDKGALYNLAAEYFEKLRREECDDVSVLAERSLASLKQWLEKHSKALER